MLFPNRFVFLTLSSRAETVSAEKLERVHRELELILKDF